MRLTVQVPDVITDNTKSEQLTELITKASQSLDVSGSILLSDGNKHFVVYTLSALTSSLIHAVSASYPLSVDNSDPSRPIIKINNPVPAVSGGTGFSTFISGTILVANTTSSFVQLSGSTFISEHLAAGNNIGLSSIGDSVVISLSSSLIGLNSVSASSFTGSGANLTNLSASQIGGLLQYVHSNITGSGSISVVNGTASLNTNVTASNYSASGYFYGDGTHLKNIGAESLSGVVKYLSAQAPLSASVDSSGTGSIALMSQSVSYNGIAVSLGHSGSIPLVQSILTGSNNITASSSSLSGAVTINLASRLQNLTDVSASYFTGSFKGDGSQLTGLISSIYTSGSITGSGLTQGDAIRLKDIVNVDTLSASQVAVSGGLTIGDYVQLLPVGATNIPSNLTASYIYTSGSTNDMYFTQYQGEFTNTTRLRWLESALSTGLLHGGIVTTVNGTTTFSVTSGSGLIVTFNATTGSDPYPTINFLSWPASSSIPLQFSSSAPITYISIKPSDADKTIGEIRQTTTPPTFGDFKTYINLGRVLHQSGAVTNGATNTPPTAYAVNSNIADFVRAIGPLKISGHYLEASASATNLSLKKSTGDSYVEGRNYAFDPNIPNIITSGSDLPVRVSKIFRQYMSGSTPIINTNGNAGYTTLDAANYQLLDGTTGSVGTDFTVQRVFWFPRAVNNALFVYYGQAKYANMDDAIAGISTENFVEGDNTRSSAILVGYVVLRGNAANFSSTATSRIYQAGLFRGGAGGGGGGVSGGATNLASLTDVSVGNQANGQALVWDGSKWANGIPHNALTASYLSGFDKNDYVTTASFNIFSGSYMTGSFTGSFSGSLNGTASAALTASYVNPLTQSIYISGDLSASSGISGSFYGDGSQITGVITASFATSSLTSSYVNPLTQSVYIDGNLSASSGISGSFYGNGSQITSITASYLNILTQSVYIDGNLSASSGISGSFYGDGSQITGIITSSFATSSLTSSYVNPLTQSIYIDGGLSASFGITGSFSGNGTLLTDLTASQIGGLQQYIYDNITGSGSISVSNGTASLSVSASVSVLTASSHVSASVYYGDGSQLSGIQTNANIYTTGSVTGSGTLADPLKLKDSITLVTDLTASYVTASNITASNAIRASYFYGNGSEITSLDLSKVSGTLTVDHGGTSLTSFTSGALYIASSTTQLVPFTGSDFQMVAWDSAVSRWQSYSQPYDIAGDFYGSYTSGTLLMRFKVPRNMTFTSVTESIDRFEYRLNNYVFVPSASQTSSAGDILTIYATSASADQYLTLLGQLR